MTSSIIDDFVSIKKKMEEIKREENQDVIIGNDPNVEASTGQAPAPVWSTGMKGATVKYYGLIKGYDAYGNPIMEELQAPVSYQDDTVAPNPIIYSRLHEADVAGKIEPLPVPTFSEQFQLYQEMLELANKACIEICKCESIQFEKMYNEWRTQTRNK